MWHFEGYDDRSQIVVSDVPEEFEVDWQEDSVTPGVDATVVVAPDEDGQSPIAWGSKLWHGRKEDLNGLEWQDQRDAIMKVIRVSRSFDVKSRDASITLSLQRHKATLPERVS